MDELINFPGGVYHISRDENDALCEAVGCRADTEGRAHPLFYYVATQVEMGISVAELCAACDFDVADGPLMTESHADFETDLYVDQNYQVAGEVVSLQRKPSRTFGEVDILSYRLTLTDMKGRLAVSCVNKWVLPRGGRSS